MCGGEGVLLSAYGFDDNFYDGGVWDIPIFQTGKGMIRRHELPDHGFQDAPLLSGFFHEFGSSETDDAFINLTDSASLFPGDLGSYLVNQEAQTRIRPERFDLSPRLSTVEINGALEE